MIGSGTRRGKLYYLDLSSKSSCLLTRALLRDGSQMKKSKHIDEIWLWHRRLGHASFGYLKKLFPKLFATVDDSSFKCDICELAHSHRVFFPPSMNKSFVPFMIIHSDVWGPSKISTLGGAHWFVTFIDDCTRMTWVTLMKTKSEVCSVFQKFHRMVARQYGAHIQVLRSDNGREYVNSELSYFMTTHGIIHQTTCPYTPQQNGVAERKNRHLLNVIRASLFEAQTPISYWGEALLSATYLINRVPSRIINFQTPYQLLSTLINAPSTINLPPHVFGCVAYVHLHKHQRSKLEPRAARCVFVGYGPHQKGYRCYHPATRHMFTTMDVQFHESTMYFSTYEFQGESSSHTEIHNLAYKDIALPDKVHHDKDNDNMALESPPGTGEEPLPGELTEAPDNIQSETIHDHMEGQVLTESSVSPYSDDRSSNVPSSDVPSQSTPAPDLPEIGKLPPRANRGIPKPTYEPDPKCKVQYPLSNYVSTKRLSESNKSFVCQLSSVSIPNSVQEGKTNLKWQEAMDKELCSLKANNT